jgi:putative heme utilization carrier protein HutX
MFEKFLTGVNRTAVREALTRDPNVLLDRLAGRLGLPEAAVAALMDENACTVLPARAFEEVWSAMTQWEKATLVTQAEGCVLEVKGRLPGGKLGHGYFNIGGNGGPLAGHIDPGSVGLICLVSKPFMGLESHSVRFYGRSGALLFAVYVGRNAKTLIPSATEGFFALRGLAGQEVAG